MYRDLENVFRTKLSVCIQNFYFIIFILLFIIFPFIKMNSEIIQILSKYCPEKSNKDSIAVNQFGDLILLTENDQQPLIVANLRRISDYESTVSDIPLDIPKEQFISYKFGNISFNQTGNSLLLWSATHVAVITIPKKLRQDGMISIPTDSSEEISAEYCCHFQLLAQDYLNQTSNNIDFNPRIVKATFHNLSPLHIVILRDQGSLLVTDIVQDITQNFNIPIQLKLTSFTFGPEDIDWLRYTIFLLTTEGEVYALCPVIPLGITVSSNSIEELWNWFEDQYNQNNYSNLYYKQINNYLKTVFGLPELSLTLNSLTIEQNDYNNDSPEKYSNSDLKNEFIHIGESSMFSPVSNHNVNNYNSILKALMQPISVQGPLIIEKNQQKSNKKRIATDITTLIASEGTEAPVISIVYSNGDVEIGIITGDDEVYFQ